MSKESFPDAVIIELRAGNKEDENFIRGILLDCSIGEGLASFSSDTMVQIKVAKNPS